MNCLKPILSSIQNLTKVSKNNEFPFYDILINEVKNQKIYLIKQNIYTPLFK
ncbi:hypothetical protein TRIP_D440452 [uncultured Paludibacter sp.]|nr:hypothetical protein TRIP_D440452 [uncultured Paludibacter sp.]